MAEGAGALVLEDMDHALARGARSQGAARSAYKRLHRHHGGKQWQQCQQ